MPTTPFEVIWKSLELGIHGNDLKELLNKAHEKKTEFKHNK